MINYPPPPPPSPTLPPPTIAPPPQTLIYVKNSNGPKTDHCGTPVDI